MKPFQVWIQLQNPNQWIFSMIEDLTIDLICKNVITNYVLKNTGTITLKPGCKLRSKELIIDAHSTQTSSFSNSFTPALNLTTDYNRLLAQT